MINLKQFGKLIPYYQDYAVWYAKFKDNDYECILDEYAYTEEKINIIREYGKCPVKSIEAGRGEVLHIYLKEGSLDNEKIKSNKNST